VPPSSSPLRSFAATVLLATLLALALLTVGGPAADAQEGTGDTEAVIAQRFADERARAGIGAAPRSGELDAVARDWARQQAADGEMRHNPDLRDQVQPARAWYENVGHLRGVPSSTSYRDAGVRLHEMWMGSDGHRANILRDPLTDVGIGVASSGDAIYVAVVFRWQGGSSAPASDPSPTPTPSEESPVARASSAPAPSSPEPSPRAAAPAPAAPTGTPPATPEPPPSADDPAAAAPGPDGPDTPPGVQARELDRRLGTDHTATPASLARPGEPGAERPPVELQLLPEPVHVPAGGEGRIAVPLVLGLSTVAGAVVVGASRPGRRGR
jgi:uncharacterized protein YkwD